MNNCENVQGRVSYGNILWPQAQLWEGVEGIFIGRRSVQNSEAAPGDYYLYPGVGYPVWGW
jgi:hypothetical protein